MVQVSGLIASRLRTPCVYCHSGRFQGQELPQWLGVRLGAVLPVRLERLPEVVVQPLVVGVAVLHHQGGHTLRVPDRQPVADRSAVVLDVERVLLQPDLLGELLHHVGQLVEGVVELAYGRGRTVAEAGVVRGDQVELVGQGRDQVAEHMRGSREAVQQQDRRGVLRTRLPVEDVQAVDVHGAVRHFRDRHAQLLARERPSRAAVPRRPP